MYRKERTVSPIFIIFISNLKTRRRSKYRRANKKNTRFSGFLRRKWRSSLRRKVSVGIGICFVVLRKRMSERESSSIRDLSMGFRPRKQRKRSRSSSVESGKQHTSSETGFSRASATGGSLYRWCDANPKSMDGFPYLKAICPSLCRK